MSLQFTMMGWVPVAKGLQALRRPKIIAGETAQRVLTPPPPPSTKAQPRATLRWPRFATHPRTSPWPPTNRTTRPPFVSGISDFPRSDRVHLRHGIQGSDSDVSPVPPSPWANTVRRTSPNATARPAPPPNARGSYKEFTRVNAACPVGRGGLGDYFRPLHIRLDDYFSVFGTKEGGVRAWILSGVYPGPLQGQVAGAVPFPGGSWVPD
jgi:hypothetical protein